MTLPRQQALQGEIEQQRIVLAEHCKIMHRPDPE
jgi:hypothetical protein